MQNVAAYVKFLEIYPYVPSYTYMFMLEAMTYKVDTLCCLIYFMQLYFVVGRVEPHGFRSITYRHHRDQRGGAAK